MNVTDRQTDRQTETPPSRYPFLNSRLKTYYILFTLTLLLGCHVSTALAQRYVSSDGNGNGKGDERRLRVLLVPSSEHKKVKKKGHCAKCRKKKREYDYRAMQLEERSGISLCNGENDPGCNGDDNYECFYARKIASLVKEKLPSEYYDTRIWYNQCTFPCEITEREEFDCIVHIHSNSGGGRGTGTETYYSPESLPGVEGGGSLSTKGPGWCSRQNKFM